MEPSKIIYKKEYSQSWALIIGINEYTQTSPLSYAVNDAEGVARILINQFNFPETNIKKLINENATQANIRSAFLEFSRSTVRPDDRILIFFAGHGHTTKGLRGEIGWLVPVNGNVQDLGTLIRWDELTRNGESIGAKHVFYIMDACYGGLAVLRSPSFGSMRFIGNMLQRCTRQVLTAGKANETVSDGNGTRVGHSIFTSHLLDALEGGASTEDGILTANGVMAYVHDRVGRDEYSQQTPHFGYIHGDGDFIFEASILHKTHSEEEIESTEKTDEDILINTSPQIVNVTAKKRVVEEAKELLSDPTKRIHLEDFVTAHIREFLDKSDLRHFPVQGANIQDEEFIERVKRYEKITINLQKIAIILAKWGNESQILLLEKIIQRVAEADKGSSGLILWLRLNWYPIQLIMYSAGIAALSSNNYGALKIILETKVNDESHGGTSPILIPTGGNISEIYEKFKLIPGHEKKYVPESEYLFKVLQPMLEDLLFLGKSYEDLFDKFEVLYAIDFVFHSKYSWGPIGRFGWKHKSFSKKSPFNGFVNEVSEKNKNWEGFKVGMFGGSFDEFMKKSEEFKKTLDNLPWF